MLEDPKGVFGEKETAYKYARKGLEKDMPEVNAFFKNLHLSETDLNDLMDAIEVSEGDSLSACKEWMQKHEDLISSWLE